MTDEEKPKEEVLPPEEKLPERPDSPARNAVAAYFRAKSHGRLYRAFARAFEAEKLALVAAAGREAAKVLLARTQTRVSQLDDIVETERSKVRTELYDAQHREIVAKQQLEAARSDETNDPLADDIEDEECPPKGTKN